MSDTAVERVSRLLEHIAKSGLNAYVTPGGEAALSQAREADRGKRPGPLSGVPVAVKDNISTRGMATTCGSRILEGYIPPYDAHVVQELHRAGAVILGKTNMDEFAMGSSTESSAWGPTRNPWDHNRVPGGSSGGSGAAVAAGEAPLALGSDTGGSVRCPASFCGISGLKPTYGLVSRYGLIAYANSLEQIGPMGRSVGDVARLLDVIATLDPRDSTQVRDTPRGGYLASLDGTDLRGLRIGLPREFLEGADPDVVRATHDSLDTLQQMGATWEEVTVAHAQYALPAYYVIAMSEASSNLSRFDGLRYGLHLPPGAKDWSTHFSDVRGQGFGPEVKRRILLGTYALSAGYYGKYYLKALQVRHLIQMEFTRLLRDHDLLITPTMPFPAFKLGERIQDPLSLYLADVDTVAVNLAGVPALSIPCGFSRGLPLGLQLIGRPFDERRLLQVGHAYQQATKHHLARPPGSAEAGGFST
ncbi:MAG: Asp-tRNA(Asn)/Glu-tRNA(Gln) amidotransferase subunit GatA [Euryarchaeota archaeon]|nr:Asp-tRNA(Asn)/Glu-tRNA(Gln) amidotransferase subunit GatA [Euryarchaeota archaeon]